jgi:hypothetical protein
MRGDYFIFWNLPDRFFTSPSFKGIISRYPHKSSPLSVFLARLKLFIIVEYFWKKYLRRFRSIG